ncbi:MAG: glycosyl transferase [Ponticaulis sp.]|nr:glycosyl transferase [Ponticaulis sp.]|tara:strand:+ start:15668 stop:16351 length:684 start_codon:yes stop_codon:yes gene_type:complete
MPAPLSIIIPTLNAGEDLISCLQSLTPGLQTGLVRELLIVDGGSSDKTVLYAYEAGARVICGASGRGRQLRAGAENARGDWLLFLHADSFLEQNWADALIGHMQAAPERAAYFQLAYRSDASEARWLEARANRRAKWFGLPYGDQGLFLSRSLYEAVGGFPDQPLMEDVAIVRALGKSRLSGVTARAFTSAEKYERDGWRKRAYANAWLLTRYMLGASPEKLAQKYR